MFVEIVEKESYNKILINSDHILDIVECDDFNFCRIVTDMIDPKTGKLIYFDTKEKNLSQIYLGDLTK